MQPGCWSSTRRSHFGSSAGMLTILARTPKLVLQQASLPPHPSASVKANRYVSAYTFTARIFIYPIFRSHHGGCVSWLSTLGLIHPRTGYSSGPRGRLSFSHVANGRGRGRDDLVGYSFLIGMACSDLTICNALITYLFSFPRWSVCQRYVFLAFDFLPPVFPSFHLTIIWYASGVRWGGNGCLYFTASRHYEEMALCQMRIRRTHFRADI